MNINKIIITVSLSLAMITSAATICVAVSVAGELENHIAGSTAQDIEMEMHDKTEVEEKIKELYEKAEQQEVYDFYISFYNSVTDLNDNIKVRREKLKASTDTLQSASQKCKDEVKAIENKSTSYANKKNELEILENSECFEKLQSALYQCDIDKINLEKIIEEYNKKKAEQGETEKKKNSSNTSTGSSKKNSSSSTSGTSSSSSTSSSNTSSDSKGTSSSGSMSSSNDSSGSGDYSSSDNNKSTTNNERTENTTSQIYSNNRESRNNTDVQGDDGSNSGTVLDIENLQ